MKVGPLVIRRSYTTGLVAAVLLALFAGCGRAPKPAAPGTHQTYQVRGQIVQLPQAGAADQSLYIHHEAIADFIDQFGQKEAMMAMTMPFQVAQGVPLQGLAVGDKVIFSLDVDWPDNRIEITRITRLPAHTMLDFGPTKAMTQP